TTGEYLQTLSAVSNYFPNFDETATTTTDAATLQSQLAGKQVFLIVEQESASAPGILGPLGTAWATVLNNFVNNGGIVIACSWQTEEHLILANSGLMNLTRLGMPTSDTIALGTSHVLNQGVSGPFTGSFIGWFSSS